MTITGLDEHKRAIEAILMVADQPVEPNLLAQLLEVGQDRIEELCGELAEEYTERDRGFVLARVAGGYRFQSHPDLAPYLEQFVLEGQRGRLSPAALETLAIVAYKQPVSRAQVAAIRGVSVDGVMRTLTQRDLIAEIGRDPGPGQPVMYGTTDSFLERLGLDDLTELPPLGNFVPAADVVETLELGLAADAAVEHALADEPVTTDEAEQPGQDAQSVVDAQGVVEQGDAVEAVIVGDGEISEALAAERERAGDPTVEDPSDATVIDLTDGAADPVEVMAEAEAEVVEVEPDAEDPVDVMTEADVVEVEDVVETADEPDVLDDPVDDQVVDDQAVGDQVIDDRVTDEVLESADLSVDEMAEVTVDVEPESAVADDGQSRTETVDVDALFVERDDPELDALFDDE